MISRPTDQSDAERAVCAYKHELMVRVMRHIVLLALKQAHVFPGDVPEDIVEKIHRQGVVSNAWGSLRALEIISPLKLTDTFPDLEIWAGRKANRNDGAKGRPVMVYRLASRSAAVTWLERNGGNIEHRTSNAERPMEEMELQLA